MSYYQKQNCNEGKNRKRKKTFVSYFATLCSHSLNTKCIMFSPFVAGLWHYVPHNERLVCTDTFALRCRNTILECLTWWKEQETENCSIVFNRKLINTVFFSKEHKILTGLSVSPNKCVNKHDFVFWACWCITVVKSQWSIQSEGREWNLDTEKGSGVCGIMFYRSMLSCMVREHYQIEITIHPQLFPFTLAPTSPYYQLYCHQPSHSFRFFPLTEKQRSRKGQCFQRCVGLSSRLNRSIQTTWWKDCIQSMF